MLETLSHTNDPTSSADAIHEHAQRGRLTGNKILVLELVRRHPFSTANELLELATPEEKKTLSEVQEVRRRLTDLFAGALIKRTTPRLCTVKGNSMVTWYCDRATHGGTKTLAECIDDAAKRYADRRG